MNILDMKLDDFIKLVDTKIKEKEWYNVSLSNYELINNIAGIINDIFQEQNVNLRAYNKNTTISIEYKTDWSLLLRIKVHRKKDKGQYSFYSYYQTYKYDSLELEHSGVDTLLHLIAAHEDYKKEQQEKRVKEVTNFKQALQEAGIDFDTFDKLLWQYNNLDYIQRDILRKEQVENGKEWRN